LILSLESLLGDSLHIEKDTSYFLAYVPLSTYLWYEPSASLCAHLEGIEPYRCYHHLISFVLKASSFRLLTIT